MRTATDGRAGGLPGAPCAGRTGGCTLIFTPALLQSCSSRSRYLVHPQWRRETTCPIPTANAPRVPRTPNPFFVLLEVIAGLHGTWTNRAVPTVPAHRIPSVPVLS